jgi:tetratricopeptide (TPR) repeat protein
MITSWIALVGGSAQAASKNTQIFVSEDASPSHQVGFPPVMMATSDPTEQQIRDAFAESYRLEALQEYSAGAKALEAMGREVIYSIYEANLRLGWLCYKAGDNDKSLSYYQRAMILQPLATEPIWGLLLPVTAKEDWIRTESLYKAILKQDQSNGTAHYQLGLIYYYRQNYPEALKYLEVSLRLSPFDYYSMLMTGWTRYFLGQKDEAKVLFDRVLRYTPQDASALEGLQLLSK